MNHLLKISRFYGTKTFSKAEYAVAELNTLMENSRDNKSNVFIDVFGDQNFRGVVKDMSASTLADPDAIEIQTKVESDEKTISRHWCAGVTYIKSQSNISICQDSSAPVEKSSRMKISSKIVLHLRNRVESGALSINFKNKFTMQKGIFK